MEVRKLSKQDFMDKFKESKQKELSEKHRMHRLKEHEICEYYRHRKFGFKPKTYFN